MLLHHDYCYHLDVRYTAEAPLVTPFDTASQAHSAKRKPPTIGMRCVQSKPALEALFVSEIDAVRQRDSLSPLSPHLAMQMVTEDRRNKALILHTTADCTATSVCIVKTGSKDALFQLAA